MQIEKHLIAYEGANLYVAFPKGPVNERHVLIIPKAHVASYLHLSPEAREEFNNLKKYLM